MTHTAAGRCRETRNETDHRFGYVLLDEFRSLFLGRPADFSHHDDGLGFGVGLKSAQAVNKVGAVYGVSTDADDRALADALAADLMHRFIGQGPGAGNNPTGPGA